MALKRRGQTNPGWRAPYGWGSGGGSRPPSSPPGEPPAEEDERKPIGVPRDYRVVVPRDMTGMSARAAEGWASQGAGHGSPHEQGPRYWEGDQWKPAQGSPDAIAQLQQDMVTAGLIPRGANVRFGTWDLASIDGYQKLLEMANINGVPHDMMLDRLIAGSAQGSGSIIDPNTGEVIENPAAQVFVPPDALPLRLPSREDMRDVTRAVVVDRLGQGWSNEDIEGFIDRYYSYAQGQAQGVYEAEVERQRAAFEAGQPISNVNVELGLASPEASLDEELRREEPDAYGAGQIASDFAPAFFDALGGYV